MSKKCKNCREPFTPIRSTLEKYCMKPECLRVFVAEAKEKEWKKRKAAKKEELMTVQDYVKIAQQVFNSYINKRDAGKPCISCGKQITGRVNASHYYNANNHWSVRFDERNVHSSCITCNQYLSGNLIEYRFRLIDKIGTILVDELDAEARKTRKYTIEELKEIITIYKEKIKNFENN